MKHFLPLLLLFCCSITAHAQSVQLPQTGQKISLYLGDDGSYMSGIPWPDPRFEDHGDGTVTDHLTGLMWSKDADCMMTFYPSYDDADSFIDGKVDWYKALDFVAGINDGSFQNCAFGHSDWRVPNINELLSLIDYGQSSPALPLGHPFVNVAFGVNNNVYVNSTTPRISESGTYTVHLGTASTVSTLKNRFSFHVWHVRSAQGGVAPPLATGQTISYYPNDDGALQKGVDVLSPDRFVDNTDGTVQDDLTGLMWTQSLELTKQMWQESLDYIARMNVGLEENFGYTDWRMPNIVELRSLLSYGSYFPAMSPYHVFTDAPTTYSNYILWSSTISADNYSDHHFGKFVSGQLLVMPRGYPRKLAAVRDNQKEPEKLPVLIVPGIFGSWSTKMFCNDAFSVKQIENGLQLIGLKDYSMTLEWELDPILDTYSTLRSHLENDGYTVVDFGYDWRKPIDVLALDLRNAIAKVKQDYDVNEVHIVAHSMGGLITRDYIQNLYQNDIKKFVMIGTPNTGSVNAYWTWEKGNFGKLNAVSFFKKTILKNMKIGCDQWPISNSSFVRSNIPSVKQLLPTFDYVYYPGVLENEYYLSSVGSMCHYNYYLLNLNANAYSLVNKGIGIKIFASHTEKTLEAIKVNDTQSLDRCDKKNWADGAPSAEIFTNPNDGDGTVLYESVYPAKTIPAFADETVSIVENIPGTHMNLPSNPDVLNDITQFLKN